MLKDSTKPAWDKLPNESRLELWLKTKYNQQSRITLRGFENIETARGQQFDLLVIDEVAFMRNWKYAWESILEPTLAFRKGKALFISTPMGFNHFYDLFNKGQQNDPFYKSWRFKSEENPFLPKERIEQAMKTSTPDYFAQEYLADFRKYTGLVYKEFQRESHVIEPFEIPEGWQIYRGFDWGDTNPSVCLWIAVDNDENWYIIDEFYEPLSGRGIDYIAGKVNTNKFSKRVIQSWADPSGTIYISDMGNRGGIYITPAVREIGTSFNSWVRFKIEKIAEKLKVLPGVEPKLKIFNTCINTIKEFETYRWKERSISQAQDLNEPDIPEKSNDHAMDALSYFAVSYIKQDEDWDQAEWDRMQEEEKERVEKL
jgi:hypothetical protein